MTTISDSVDFLLRPTLRDRKSLLVVFQDVPTALMAITDMRILFYTENKFVGKFSATEKLLN